MNRRKFFKHLSILVPGLVSIPSFLSAAQLINTQSGSVIIVGAGAAGLYAAKVLKESGIDVTIIEASAIHGGRVRPAIGFADFNVEAGAEFVHGKGNAAGTPPSFLWSAINTYNIDLLLEYGSYKELYQIDSDYEIAPPFWNAQLESAWQFYLNMYAYTGDDILMSDYLELTYGITESHPYWHFYEAWIGAEFGTSIKRIGMKSIAISENLWLTGDKDFFLDTSYRDLLDTLFFDGVLENIEYNAVVDAIDFNSDTISVHCSNGLTYTADKILVTVPLTILKENTIAFTPALPENKMHAIETIGMGAGMKIILKFSETFWPDDIQDMTIDGYTTEIWTPGIDKTGATNNVLMCFIMGENAEYLSAQGPAAIDTVIAELDLLFAGNASAFLIDSLIVDWSKEPYIKGAYSFPAPFTYISDTDSTRIDLSLPVDCKLFFAGEATNNNHPATVHGALESGARAAAEILECLTLNTINTDTNDSINIFTVDKTVYFNLELKQIYTASFNLYALDGKRIQHFLSDRIPAGKNTWAFSLPSIAKGNYIFEVTLDKVKYSKQIYVN